MAGGSLADLDLRSASWASSTILFRPAQTTAVVDVIRTIVAALNAVEVRLDHACVASQIFALTAADLISTLEIQHQRYHQGAFETLLLRASGRSSRSPPPPWLSRACCHVSARKRAEWTNNHAPNRPHVIPRWRMTGGEFSRRRGYSQRDGPSGVSDVDDQRTQRMASDARSSPVRREETTSAQLHAVKEGHLLQITVFRYLSDLTCFFLWH
jgi:hypothetical protein